ncbi:conserved hypothetical protein [Nitrospina gracilis 3/211]|uniref:YlxP-like protein n=1 Tax=Nitrospina gracilis (strain 3/211) TaxID=1266370 RepID=M1Z3K2_NITG3|nr:MULTISPECIES: DUF503 domain-containing protein [Nitrospina]MCF8724798.1 uncharacterized protein YlxP (DUF503 family) [Nitrospina sp. Nb-3]CCQ92073.1 conserved hypothetical protein [Nitrospina gracilis 3/211]
MKVGCCAIKLFLHGNESLKGKRKIIRAIKDRVKNKFNISISEVGDQDVHQSIHLGIAAVSGDGPYVEGLMQQVVNFIDQMHLAEMTDYQIEVLNLGKG